MTGSLRATLLRLVISFGAIGLIVYFMRDKIGEAWVILRTDVLWSWFFIGLGSYLIANIIIGWRLYTVFKTQTLDLSFPKTLYLAFLGLFFNLFLPSAIGGDVAKIYFAAKYTGKKIQATSAVFQDRLIGFVTIMLMAVTATALVSQEIDDPRVHQMVYLFVAIMAGTIFFFASRRVARIFSFLKHLIPSEKMKAKLSELYEAIYSFRHHPGLMAGALALAVVGQVFFIVTHYFLTRSLGVEVSVWLFFLIVPVVAIVSMMPSLGGLGVREAGLIFFMNQYMSAERALVLSMLLFIIIYGLSLSAGILFALMGGLKAPTNEDLEGMEAV